MISSPVKSAHSRLTEAVDELSAACTPAATADDLLSVLTLGEGVSRRLEQIVVAVVADLLRRGTFAERGYRDAVTAVETGKADAAIVFRTDARSSQKVAVALSIPRDRTPGIVYQAAVMKNSTSKDAARAFLSYLRDRDARAVFQREGFVTLIGGQMRPATIE